MGKTLPLVFISLLLTGCFAVEMPSTTMAPLAGQVVSVQPTTVIYGIQSALAGHAGTTILSDGAGRYLVVWAYEGKNAAGFFALTEGGAVLNAGDILKAGGNLARSTSVSQLVDALKSNGWAALAPGAAPAVLSQIVASRLISAPVILLAVGAFGEGGFEEWFNQEFYPQEIEL